MKAEDLFLTRVQRTVCGMEERHRRGTAHLCDIKLLLSFLFLKSSSSSPLCLPGSPTFLSFLLKKNKFFQKKKIFGPTCKYVM